MSLLIQRTERKFTLNIPQLWSHAFILAGIVAIAPTLASAEQASCSQQSASDAGIRTFLEHAPPEPVADTPFYNQNGDEVRISDYKGTPLVVNFWATWCPPCVAEMPSLDHLKELMVGTGIDVLAISEDREGDKVVARFYAENKITNLDVLIDRKMALLRAHDLSGIPTTFLVDADGRRVATVVGEAEWDSPKIVALVKTCLLPENYKASGS